METIKQILEILAALLTPTIGVVGAIVLVNQYRLERLRWKLALYDRRYAVYLAVQEYLSEIMARADVKDQEMFAFLRNTRDKQFLFGKDIHQFIEQLYLKSVDLNYINKELGRIPVGEERNKAVHTSSELFKWFKAQYDSASTLFGAYLSIDKK